MAPAAVDTITAHFRDLNRDTDYYDLIATGDLGRRAWDRPGPVEETRVKSRMTVSLIAAS